MISFDFDDSEMVGALETLIDKGITPDIYAKSWGLHQQSEITRLRDTLNKAYEDLAMECNTCAHENSEICDKCNNFLGGFSGDKCLWEWRGLKDWG